MPLALHDLNGVTVRVADHNCFAESRPVVRQLDSSRGNEGGPAVPESLRGLIRADPQESGLPVDQVAGLLLRRKWTSVARRQVFEKLDARARRGPQRSDAQACAENVVEPLLLGTVILALARDLHPQPVPIELQAGLCVSNDDRGVIYSQKQAIRRGVPLRIALARREPQDLQRMPVRIAKIERADAARVEVPDRQKLRPRRRMLHLVLPEPLVTAIHVADNDRDVLKPVVI